MVEETPKTKLLSNLSFTQNECPISSIKNLPLEVQIEIILNILPKYFTKIIYRMEEKILNYYLTFPDATLMALKQLRYCEWNDKTEVTFSKNPRRLKTFYRDRPYLEIVSKKNDSKFVIANVLPFVKNLEIRFDSKIPKKVAPFFPTILDYLKIDYFWADKIQYGKNEIQNLSEIQLNYVKTFCINNGVSSECISLDFWKTFDIPTSNFELLYARASDLPLMDVENPILQNLKSLKLENHRIYTIISLTKILENIQIFIQKNCSSLKYLEMDFGIREMKHETFIFDKIKRKIQEYSKFENIKIQASIKMSNYISFEEIPHLVTEINEKEKNLEFKIIYFQKRNKQMKQ